MTDQPFSESDFELEMPENQASDLPGHPQIEHSKVGESRSPLKPHRLVIAIGCAVAVLTTVGAGLYIFSKNSTDEILALDSFPIQSYVGGVEDHPTDNFSVAYGDNGVEINKVESKIAETLLDSRPTHIEVSELIDKRLDSLFDDPENLAKLREINRGDRQALQRDMSMLRENISMLRVGIDELKDVTTDLKRSQDAIASRQALLEKKLAGSAKKPTAESKKVVLSPTLPWELVALGETVAIIRNTKTQEKVRVAVGHSVPGCGRIKALSVEKRAIETSQGCLIKRNQG